MNLNLFNNKSILEQEYILKYFYLLDPQPLVSEIRIDLKQKGISKLDMSSETIDIFFHTVFDHMYSHASQYVTIYHHITSVILSVSSSYMKT